MLNPCFQLFLSQCEFDGLIEKNGYPCLMYRADAEDVRCLPPNKRLYIYIGKECEDIELEITDIHNGENIYAVETLTNSQLDIAVLYFWIKGLNL